MKLIKDGKVWDVTDTDQINVFLKQGWTLKDPPPVVPPPAPTPPTADEIKAMPDDKLMEYAHSTGIDTSNAKSREQLLKLLLPKPPEVKPEEKPPAPPEPKPAATIPPPPPEAKGGSNGVQK